MRVLFAPHARIDLLLIEEYIARDSLTAAETFLASIRRACQDLGEYPERYPQRPELFAGGCPVRR